ncbi:MAG: M23 family metallopeptidase [Actinomycetaceae bacterium]|nr:M23 family metallopeptidase [Actinomycetaceae bacterium]
MNKLLVFSLGLVATVGVVGGVDLWTATPAHSPVTPPTITSTAYNDAQTEFTSPTGSDPIVIREYSAGEQNWLPGHRGVDVELAVGSPVYAAGSGTVIYAGMLNDRSLVSIEHANGLRTTYEPVTALVTVGEHVVGGQLIGTLDAGHCVFNECLHWGAKYGSEDYINPLALLQGPIRLKE